MRTVYLDYAAATPVDPLVLRSMQPYFSEKFGNPGSLHGAGEIAQKALEASRTALARILQCKSHEIIFTNGGTESVNLAIKGLAFAARAKGNHIVTTGFEHSAVLESCAWLETQGFRVTYVPPTPEGFISEKAIEAALTSSTVLLAVMYVNNELGTIQPLRALGLLARKKNILFYSDACQAPLHLDCIPSHFFLDALTLSGSKFYGTKGIGILYKQTDVPLQPLLHGGGQEFGLHAGTENVASIVGMARALELIVHRRTKETKRILRLREELQHALLSLGDAYINGRERAPNFLNIGFRGISSERLVSLASQKGVFISTGAACDARTSAPSHVLKLLDPTGAAARESIRITLGLYTTRDDIRFAGQVISKAVKLLRTPSNTRFK